MQRHLVLELLYILYKLQPSRRRIRFALIDSVSLGSFTASKDMLFKMKPSTCTFGRGCIFSERKHRHGAWVVAVPEGEVGLEESG